MDKVGFAAVRGGRTACRCPGPRCCATGPTLRPRPAATRLPVRGQATRQDASPGWRTPAPRGSRSTDAATLLEVYDRVAHWVPCSSPRSGSTATRTSCTPATPTSAPVAGRWPPSSPASCGSGRPTSGTSASGEECRNEEVLDTTIRLFGGLGYRGLAYLEMKRDARTGRLLIIEPNVGRPTGRSAIAEAGGVELRATPPTATPPDCRSRPRGSSGTARRGGWTCAGTCRRPSSPGAAGPSRCGQWLRWVRGPKAHAIWSRRDPRPFVSDLTGAARTGLRLMRDGQGRRGPCCGHHDDRGRGVGMTQGADVTGVLGWGVRRYAWLIALFVIALGVVVPGVLQQRAETVPGDRPGRPRPRVAHPQHRRAAEDGHRRVRATS